MKPLLALLPVLAVLAAVEPACAADRPLPNIVVLLIDDMGVMDTSVPMLTDAAGKPQSHPLNEWYRTPNMERLAAQGVRFSDFYAQSTCSPTRISILTGQNAARHRATSWINPATNNKGAFGPPDWNWAGLTKQDVTLPRLLRAAGYRTVHIGKGHFGPRGKDGSDPRNLGFDVNIAGDSAGQPGSYYGKKNYGKVPGLDKYHGTDTFLTEALTLEAKEQISGAVAAKKPFFLYLPHYAVHAPHNSDPRFSDHYTRSDKAKGAQAFATLIEGIDKSLGDILDHVNQLGIGKDTLVIFLGDNGSDAPLGAVHGYSSAAPLRGKKGTCYEGGTRVPFIAAWAEADPANPWQKKLPIVAGGMQRQLGTVMDLYPTLLELTGVANPQGHVIDGVSLRPQLAGGRNEQRPEIFMSHFPHEHRSDYFTTFRKGDWKVIYHYPITRKGAPAQQKAAQAQPAGGRYELYHLAADPYEATNLADQKPEQLRLLMQAMVDRLELEKARYPVDAKGERLRPLVP